MSRKRTAILISGRGSNMEALLEAARAPDFPAEPALVFSNRADARGLSIARARGAPIAVVDHKIYAGREEFDRSLHALLESHRIELLCLAGFMRQLSPWFASRWEGRALNIHPSLLPAFRGLHTHERVIAAGCKISGCTVHFVRPEIDEGPIVAQAAVPVLADDTAETLALRVLEAEHRLYPHALALVASGAVSVKDELVVDTGQGKRVVDADEKAQGPLFSPPLP